MHTFKPGDAVVYRRELNAFLSVVERHRMHIVIAVFENNAVWDDTEVVILRNDMKLLQVTYDDARARFKRV